MMKVVDVTPKNILVIDVKPSLNKVSGETKTYREDRTIRVGEPMGLLLCLTYPQTVSFTGDRI
jgi:hypothetical protein